MRIEIDLELITVFLSIFQSVVGGVGFYFWGSTFSYAFSMAMEGYLLGYSIHSNLCRKYHSREALRKSIELEMHRLFTRLEAERLIKE